jgi:hypothetical protein
MDRPIERGRVEFERHSRMMGDEKEAEHPINECEI